MKSLSYLIVLIICTVSTIYSQELSGGVSYMLDNVGYDAVVADAQMYNISLGPGLITAGTNAAFSRLSHNVNGYRALSDNRLTARLRYRFSSGSSELSPEYSQLWCVEGTPGRMRSGIVLPVSFSFGSLPAVRFLPKVRFEFGVATDNPFTQAIGLQKRSVTIDLAARIARWEYHVEYQNDHYNSIAQDDYEQILSDTAFFNVFYGTINPITHYISDQVDPLPDNDLHSASVYAFGPVTPVLYAGASVQYRTSEKNLYLPIADTASGRILADYLPYRTPLDEWAVHVILAYAKEWKQADALINYLYCKVDLPAVSGGRYRGYYESIPGNLLAGFGDFYYQYNGLEPLSVSVALAREITEGLSLRLDYECFSRPYNAL